MQQGNDLKHSRKSKFIIYKGVAGVVATLNRKSRMNTGINWIARNTTLIPT